MTPTTEEAACDEIARIWVRGGRSLIQFRQLFDEIVALFDFNHRRGTKNVYMLDLVDTWEEDYSLTVDDFIRLKGEIEGWIVSHMSAFGRITWQPTSIKSSSLLSTSASTRKPSQSLYWRKSNV